MDGRERAARAAEYCARFGPAIESAREKTPLAAVILVGSRARGDDVSSSDIDILVVAETVRGSGAEESILWGREIELALRRGAGTDDRADVFCVPRDRFETNLEQSFASGGMFVYPEEAHRPRGWPATMVDHRARGALQAAVYGIPLQGGAYLERLRARHAKALAARAPSVLPPSEIPDIRDGLGFAQRRLLATLERSGATGEKPLHSARIVHDCFDRLHPFGRGGLYYTLIDMAVEWRARRALVEYNGSFGSLEGSPPAGMRYTMASPSALADALLADLPAGVTPRGPSSGEEEEALFLPSRLPAALLLGRRDRSGATIFPAYPLAEICDAIVAILDEPAKARESVGRIVRGPDLPGGGTIADREAVRALLEEGAGRVEVRSKGGALVTLDLEHRLLVDGEERVLPLHEILARFVASREAVVARRAEVLLLWTEERRAVVHALLAASTGMRDLVDALREAASPAEARKRVKAEHKWSDAQFDHVVRDGLLALTASGGASLRTERVALDVQRTELAALMRDGARIRRVIRDETIALRDAFADGRRTRIGAASAKAKPRAKRRKG